MKWNNIVLAVLLATIIIWPLGSMAQEQAPASTTEEKKEEEKPFVLPPVTVTAPGYRVESTATATKTDAPLRDIPQTINVVPKELFEEQGALSMQDVLRNVPGVGFSHGDGARDQVTLRGFSAIGDHFTDGVRDDALYFRDLANIERVEILKGPASVLYGRGSSGGMINRVTKKPTGEAIRSIDTTYGRFNLRRVTSDIGGPINSAFSYRFNSAYENSRGFRRSFFLERYHLASSLAWQPTADTRLLFQFEHLNDVRLMDLGIPALNGRPVKVPIDTYYGSANGRADDFVRSRVTAPGFTFDHRINDQWTLRDVFRAYWFDLERNSTTAGTVDTTGAVPIVKRNRGFSTRNERGFFNQTEAIHKTSLFGIKNELLYGLELGHQNKEQFFINKNNIDEVPLFNPGGKRVPRIPPGTAPGTDGIGIMGVGGLYAQDLVTLTEEWKALVGLRYDYFRQRLDERLPGKPNLERVDNEFSPRAGLVYQPTNWSAFYTSFSRSFQPSGELFAVAANNANIEPEQTRNYEIGAKLDFLDGRLSSNLALFRLVRLNIKTTDPADSTKLIPVGEQRTHGIEWTLAGEILPGWQVSAGYAFLDGRITKSTAKLEGIPLKGKRPSLTPRNGGNVWTTYRFANGFGLGGGLNFVGDRFAAPNDAVTLEQYVTADAALFYRTRGGLDMTFDVKNLFNKKYFIAAHGGANNFNLPGAPITAQLTVRYNF